MGINTVNRYSKDARVYMLDLVDEAVCIEILTVRNLTKIPNIMQKLQIQIYTQGMVPLENSNFSKICMRTI